MFYHKATIVPKPEHDVEDVDSLGVVVLDVVDGVLKEHRNPVSQEGAREQRNDIRPGQAKRKVFF